MPTLTPLNEEERLEVLRACRILDTEPERAYDDIVALATHVCDVPIAAVSFIDDKRQWSKAARGVERGEAPRDIAFCNHAIELRESMEVSDARRDPRFAGNPQVTGEPNIRYYFGVPLRLEEGHAVGTLCLIDRKPRQLLEGQVALVESLARQLVDQLEWRRRNFQLIDALERTGTLEGLLPVCVGCKKVREEAGYWRQVEAYLQTRGTQVTHGLCPSCEAHALREI